ncbi:CocE/NonD family hydrolase [Mucilaginibacter conchicola]|uniref:CocE/NonD family hydrolase n=1 Tax=Mucilaginibacter conchicola TaxID=2303333 RepID=A0A372NXK8_9SPHI|nr:CocE/NonD family hydrolase [Mucilaginibacter conchicola]RFZ94399.1 CocE/NonD family hydrolase [Mucilaginibacter conchicola]
MKRSLLLAFLLSPFISFAQNADSAWFVNNYVKKEVMIPMRDGAKLFTSIYAPKDGNGKHPILITRTPYSCYPYGEAFRPYWRSFMMAYLKEGYILVTQDIRGRWMSEGKFEVVRPFNPNKKTKNDIDEASDTYDSIDWLVKNIKGNNGKVGVSGISFPGFYATMAALSGHPALVAVSPQAPVTDRFFGDDDHHNGVLFLMDAFDFHVGYGFSQPRPQPTKLPAKTLEFTNRDNYDYYLKMGALPNFTRVAGDSLEFWNNMMKHPNFDAWWKARDARSGIKNVKPAMLVVGGLFDAEDNFGAWNTYQALVKQSPKTNSKLVVGPWYHGQWASGNGTHLGNINFDSNTATWYTQNIEIPFFDYYLLGKGSIDSIKQATIFFSGENKWRTFDEWPVKSAVQTPVYLREGGKLSFQQVQTFAPAFDSYVSDPAKPVPYAENVHFSRTREYMTDDQRFAARRPDVLVYEMEVLDKDITIGGPVTADLLVAISGTDADFVVKLIDVFPEDAGTNPATKYPMGGYQMLVRGDIMRGRYRNSFEKPEAFTPGQTAHVKFTMPDVAHTFKKGHKIMVQIQSSWFPLADRNPQQFVDIYQAKDSDFVKETINIYQNQSKVMLPVLK